MLVREFPYLNHIAILVISFLLFSHGGIVEHAWAVDDPVLKTIYEEQNALSAIAVSSLDQALQEFYDLSVTVETISVIDEETGQRILVFFQDTLIPQMNTTIELLGDMLANSEAASLLEATAGTVASVQPNQILEPVISAIVILAVAAGSLYITSRKIVGRVKAVNRQVDQARAEGHSQAEAFGIASPQFKKAMGDSIRDTQSFIASNALASPAAAEPLRPCGQAAVTVITDRGETIKEAVRLIGRQKSVPQQSTNLEAQQSGAFEDTHPIYLGTSTTGTFEHIPLGNWDFIVFSDQRVPTIIGDIPITTCEVPQPVTVTMPSIDENVVGPAWKLVEVVANPNNGSLSDDTPRLSTACTIDSSVLSIDHSRRSSNTTTVDVTFTFSFAPLPRVVGVGEVVAIPINLTVAGEHISENALATAGFLGFRDSLSVAACSLTACGGSPDAMPEQSGVANILFSGEPSDPSRILEFDAFLSDTTRVSSNCRTRYLYEFVPAQ